MSREYITSCCRAEIHSREDDCDPPCIWYYCSACNEDEYRMIDREGDDAS